MAKYKIIFLIIFLAAFLLGPTYMIAPSNTGIELAYSGYIQIFGGLFFLLPITTPGMYTVHFGNLLLLPNLIWLLFFSLLCARILTYLFIRFKHLQDKAGIFWSVSYLKKQIRNVLTSIVAGVVIYLLTSYLLGARAGIYVDIYDSNLVVIPITVVETLLINTLLSLRTKILTTRLQKLLFFSESTIFVLGFLSIILKLFYYFLGYY